MAATILNSTQAIAMSVFVVRAFVKMRELLADRGEFARRLEEIERKLLRHDSSLQEVYREIKALRQGSPSTQRPQIGLRTDTDHDIKG